MNLSRRSFFAGAAGLIAAPAIVRVSSIMPVSAPKLRMMTAREVMERQAAFNEEFRAVWAKAYAQHFEDLIVFGNSTLKIESAPAGIVPKIIAMGPRWKPLPPAQPGETYQFERLQSTGVLLG